MGSRSGFVLILVRGEIALLMPPCIALLSLTDLAF